MEKEQGGKILSGSKQIRWQDFIDTLMPATLPLNIFLYDRQERWLSIHGEIWQIIIENIGY